MKREGGIGNTGEEVTFFYIFSASSFARHARLSSVGKKIGVPFSNSFLTLSKGGIFAENVTEPQKRDGKDGGMETSVIRSREEEKEAKFPFLFCRATKSSLQGNHRENCRHFPHIFDPEKKNICGLSSNTTAWVNTEVCLRTPRSRCWLVMFAGII